MSCCTNCGSNSPCSCSQQVQTSVGRTCVTSCGCGNPSCCGTCGCNTALPASPLPFYACAPACPENHKQTVVVQNFYYDIAAQNTWNVPDCGETAVLYVPGIKSIAIGAYIWSSEFGYFEVTAFDSSSNQVTVINNCNEDNAAAGTNVPACSKFTVSDPPQEDTPTSDSCVAIDFTAPAVGVCIPITLTNLDSIQASDLIQIGAGRYRVASIDGPDVITICNDGLGLVAGTAVIARDPAGNYQYCITVVSTCCERLQEEFGGDLTPCSNFENKVISVFDTAPEETSVTINNPNTTHDSPVITLALQNESTCRDMKATVTVTYYFSSAFLGTTGFNTVTYSLFEVVDAVPPAVVQTGRDGWGGNLDNAALYRNFSYTTVVDIPAATTVTLSYFVRFLLVATDDGSALYTKINLNGNALGVAV